MSAWRLHDNERTIFCTGLSEILGDDLETGETPAVKGSQADPAARDERGGLRIARGKHLCHFETIPFLFSICSYSYTPPFGRKNIFSIPNVLPSFQ